MFALYAIHDLNNKLTFSDQVITLRGCSTKRPVFFVECESHMSDLNYEQFCYCSFDLCNATVFGCTANVCLCICAFVMIIIIVS